MDFEVYKISDLTADKAVDVLCELSVYLANILTDKQLIDELKTELNSEDIKTKAQQIAVVTDRFVNLIPIILKKHKSDVFGILATLSVTADVTVDEIAQMNIIVVMNNIRKIVQDKEFIDFFKSCAPQEAKE